MTERRRALLGLTAWLVGLIAALAGLHALGDGALAAPPIRDVETWLAARDAASAAFAVVRLLVLALGWYLLASTALAVGLHLGRAPVAAAAAAVEATTPAFVWRLVRSAAGLTLAAGAFSVAGPVLAATADDAVPVGEAVTMRRLDPAAPDDHDHPPQVLQRRLPDQDAGEGTVTMRRLDDPPPTPTPTEPSAPATAPDHQPAPAAAIPPTTWTVESGQHLWGIASSVLTAHLRRTATDREVDPFWRRLVEVNRPRLADPSNPDLLLVGDVLEIPSPDG